MVNRRGWTKTRALVCIHVIQLWQACCTCLRYWSYVRTFKSARTIRCQQNLWSMTIAVQTTMIKMKGEHKWNQSHFEVLDQSLWRTLTSIGDDRWSWLFIIVWLQSFLLWVLVGARDEDRIVSNVAFTLRLSFWGIRILGDCLENLANYVRFPWDEPMISIIWNQTGESVRKDANTPWVEYIMYALFW